MNEQQKDFKRKASFSFLVVIGFMLIFGLFSVSGVLAQSGEAEASVEVSDGQSEIAKFGLIAAAIAFGFGAIGAGIAIANVGAAAMAAIGEKPEIASQALIFIALAEGLVVFGFITALMILGKF
ncbi:MAG: ATPase [Spirochaetales bacterium]|jgi:V/A-type H+/Na+-transporting ATPase subunit K|nr:ATPase [Spirochaetales bacterium]